MATERVFIPWGEFKPDQRDFAHRDLTDCKGVLPVYGNFVARPRVVESATTWVPGVPTGALGLHCHPTGGASWLAYLGDTTSLWEMDPTAGFARTDKTRLVGGPYGAGRWVGTSFGDAVIMTSYADAPQILLTPGTANFADLATSPFQPRFKFVTTLKNNVVGLNCSLPAPYDTLAAGANPQLVVWSQNENARAWGSPNVDPQFVGADYQLLLNDFGQITGGVGGEFVLIAQQRAWVKMEGPSGSAFSFRVIVAGTGCRFPRSIGYYDGDVYFWGPGGPSRLRGGEGPVERLLDQKAVRTFLDNTTGLSQYALYSSVAADHIGIMIDTDNGLIAWAYTCGLPVFTAPAENVLVYNVSENRFTILPNQGTTLYPAQHIATSSGWIPFRDSIWIGEQNPILGGNQYVGSYEYTTGESAGGAVFELGFIQLAENRSTRVTRVRPVFSLATPVNDAGALTIQAQIITKARTWPIPSEDGPFTNAANLDTHGFITCPTSKFGDFHRVRVQLDPGTRDLFEVAEFKGVEVEFQQGPVYAV